MPKHPQIEKEAPRYLFLVSYLKYTKNVKIIRIILARRRTRGCRKTPEAVGGRGNRVFFCGMKGDRPTVFVRGGPPPFFLVPALRVV